MPVFSSDRERRLWFWTLAVLVAIYATLGPAGAIAEALRERNLLRVSFAVVLSLGVLAVGARWVRGRPGWGEVGAAIGVGVAYLVMFVRMGSPEERTHLIEYGIVAALIHQALLERARNGRAVRAPAAITVAVTAFLGVLDECIQALLPNRVFDFRDIGFNALAAFMMIAARLAIAKQRGPGWRLWFLWLIGGAWSWGVGMFAPFGTPGGIETLQTAPPALWSGYLGFTLGAFLAGALQWLAFRRYLDKAGRWVLTNLGAAAVAGVVVFGASAIDPDVGWLVGIASFGLAAGVLQWLMLKQQVPRAAWWILASAVGWIVGIPAGEEVGWNGLGAVHGLVTGTVLVILLRQDPTTRPSPPAPLITTRTPAGPPR